MTTTRWMLPILLLLPPLWCNPAGAAEGLIRWSEAGHLEYLADSRGNLVVDFSHCGYRGSDVAIPVAIPRVTVRPSGADDTRRLQAAIDFVARQPIGSNGLRGAVWLEAGEFLVSGQLKVNASGVVLRGQGASGGGTVLRARGNDRRALILLRSDAKSDIAPPDLDEPRLIVDAYVPTGAKSLQLDSTSGLAVGQRVRITHPSSKAWIARLRIDRLGWREGTRDIQWMRTITHIEGDSVVLDAPLTLALDRELTQATLQKVNLDTHLQQVGVQDVCLLSDFDPANGRDEEHAWYGVQMDGVQDGWVQRVAFRHFAGGAVVLGEATTRITVVDCASLDPVSELGGYRRLTFFTLGQQCLFLRCWSEQGLHDFSAGHCAAGPNAFVQCYAKRALGDSGPRESCAVGVLYDNVRMDGHDLNLMNRWDSPTKAGWSAINCLLWQCQAARVRCEQPPVGINAAVGIWAELAGDGYFEASSDFVKPISLFQQQLRERVGQVAADRAGPFLLNPVGATNPSLEQAAQFTNQSTTPAKQLIELIQAHWRAYPRSAVRVPRLEQLEPVETRANSASENSSQEGLTRKTLSIQNGWLLTGDQLTVGKHYTPLWWRGELPRERAEAMGPAITRFAPGRIGVGNTDDLPTFAEDMAANRIVGYDHHYGLWYDRRRDDHLMVRRRDGEVIPPFYEQPFARSGMGQAWDGLSRYDLTRFNAWYWNRLDAFAELGSQHGFVIFHHNYFQHNILEAGAHWADSPWRSANNLDQTDFPEPPPYVGDKRIFLEEQFYDVSQPKLRQLHRNYIRQCLNNFVGSSNVVQLTSAEFTGPLSFVQFWIDTIVQWEQETGNQALIGLSCTKDVQDAILDDPSRAPHVDVIDIRYWTYTEDQSLYAPPGGKHLAPRQHIRQLKPKSTSFDSVARSVRDYRERFPDKAVTYYADVYCRAKREGWAILLGGGSLANVPSLPAELAQAILRMRPSDPLKLDDGLWSLADGDREFLVYGQVHKPVNVVLPSGEFEWAYVDVSTGMAGDFRDAHQPAIPCTQQYLLWIRRK